MDSLHKRFTTVNENAGSSEAFKTSLLKTTTESSNFSSSSATSKSLGSRLSLSCVADNNTSSNLNEFLLAQLERQSNSSEIPANTLTLPKFRQNKIQLLNDNKTERPFIIPLLKMCTNPSTTANQATKFALTTLNTNMQNLTVTENLCEVEKLKHNLNQEPVIDLTKALSATNIQQNLREATGRSNLHKTKCLETADFDIPFIECDRGISKNRRVSDILRFTSNTYCQMDVTMSKQHYFHVSPSACGRIICLKYTVSQPLGRLQHIFKAKHNIQCFRFDTKSPDDKILATLGKYQR